MTHLTPPLHDPLHPCMTHPTPTFPPHPHTTPAWTTHPCMTHPIPVWTTTSLHDPPHPCMNHHFPTWPTQLLYDPPHPCMTHPTPIGGPLSVDMQPYGCFIVILGHIHVKMTSLSLYVIFILLLGTSKILRECTVKSCHLQPLKINR